MPQAPKPPREESEIVRDLDAAIAQVNALNEKARTSHVSDADVERIEDRIYALEAEIKAAKSAKKAPTTQAASVGPLNPNTLRQTSVNVTYDADKLASSTTAETGPAATPKAADAPSSETPAEAVLEAAVAPEPEASHAPKSDDEMTIEELRERFHASRTHRPYEDQEPYEGVFGVNPDRVKLENRAQEVEVVKVPAHSITKEKEITRWHKGSLEWARNTRAGKWLRNTLLLAVAGTIATNVTTEAERGSDPTTARAESVAKALDPMSVESMAQQVQDQVCSFMNVDFMHRFKYRGEDGRDHWNPGAAALPMAIEFNHECTAKVDVQVHIPYDFARTFSEIAATNPEKRQELVDRLAKFITQKVQNKLEIRGIAGITGTGMVYDRAHNTFSNQIDLGKLDIHDMEIAGEASAEAKASAEHAGVASLEGYNPENAALAHKRLVDSAPLIKAAFKKAGVSSDVLDHINEVSYERDLYASQVHELAGVARAVLGTSVESDEEMAYQLVQEINSGNPIVKKAVDANKGYHDMVQKYIIDHRGVDVSFTADTKYKDTSVWNVSIPWPLLLLSLPFFVKGRLPRRYKEIVRETKDVPAVMGKDLVNMPQAVARRLFSETTPSRLDEKRDFNEVYDSIDLAERQRDTDLLLEHMLLEEVLPTLSGRAEPMIDYEEVVNAAREYLSADTRRGEVTKGAYPTTAEAERRTAELLLSMWERHDAATYPMQGIDLKKTLNYRHSEHIVFWAKTLAGYFMSVAQENRTRDEFARAVVQDIEVLNAERVVEEREALDMSDHFAERGMRKRNVYSLRRKQERNMFVQSETPLRG